MKIKSLVCLMILVLAVTVNATPIEVGTGDYSAEVSIEWTDSFIADFVVHFSNESVTGEYLMFTLESELANFDLDVTNYGSAEVPSYVIDIIAFDGHTDGPYNSNYNDHWWHYWVKEDGGSWASSGVGMSARTVVDGSSDAWVFGHAGTPTPEPATMALLGLGGLLLRRKKA